MLRRGSPIRWQSNCYPLRQMALGYLRQLALARRLLRLVAMGCLLNPQPDLPSPPTSTRRRSSRRF